MKIKCQKPKFFYDFKKQRTVMLKDKEPVKKEHYHITYLRMQENEKKEAERKKRQADKRRLALEQAE